MTYTGRRKQVMTVTDRCGYITTNIYDADDRLLTQVREARVTYTYDKDRLKTIGHNGFTYAYI